MDLDVICNEVVSNLRVGDNAVSVINLNSPYDLLVDLAKISTGRRTKILIEPILNALFNVLNNYKLMYNKLDQISLITKNLIKSERVIKNEFLL